MRLSAEETIEEEVDISEIPLSELKKLYGGNIPPEVLEKRKKSQKENDYLESIASNVIGMVIDWWLKSFR